MKVLISSLMIAAAVATLIRAQEKSASPAEKTYPEVPKEYEVGEDTISPDGRFAILYPVRDDDSNSDSMLPNLLVRLKPYAVLKELETGDGVTWKGGRGAADAKWNGNDWVAVWHHRKWGDEDLVVYQIANDKIKREEKIWGGRGEIFRSRLAEALFEKVSERKGQLHVQGGRSGRDDF
jgi:hypothetical protein